MFKRDNLIYKSLNLDDFKKSTLLKSKNLPRYEILNKMNNLKKYNGSKIKKMYNKFLLKNTIEKNKSKYDICNIIKNLKNQKYSKNNLNTKTLKIEFDKNFKNRIASTKNKFSSGVYKNNFFSNKNEKNILFKIKINELKKNLHFNI